MKKKYEKAIRSLLEKGETENLEREMSLAAHYLSDTGNNDKKYHFLLRGLETGIPVPHIIGYTLIDDVKILINRHVLHPGPETVTLIQKAIDYILKNRSKVVLDLCTGSGVIAVVVAKKCQATKVIATDISPEALQVAKSNALANGVEVEFLRGNLFASVFGRLFYVIISNPPYVKNNAISDLPDFVKKFAPHVAIDGGYDGLFFHRAILKEAGKYLSKNGVIFLECENDQDHDVAMLAGEYGWTIRESYLNRFNKIRGFMFSGKTRKAPPSLRNFKLKPIKLS